MRIPAAIALAAAATLAVPAAAFADFEGVLLSKVSGDMNGTARTWISKVGVRSEMDMEVPEAQRAIMGKNLHMVTIVKAAEPNRTYLVNDAGKSYSVSEHKPGERDADDTKYTVKRLGKDTVAGFSCQRVEVTSSLGTDAEMCVSPDVLGGSDWFRALQMRAEARGRGLFRALLDAGVKGFPIRWSNKGRGKEGKGAFTMELVSAERKSVPASTFAVPAGYTKSESVMPMSPEMQKRMAEAMKRREESMKDMTPEQRKQMEEMMKKYGGSGAAPQKP